MDKISYWQKQYQSLINYSSITDHNVMCENMNLNKYTFYILNLNKSNQMKESIEIKDGC